jgi:RNA polymerase sigma-32 factor
LKRRGKNRAGVGVVEGSSQVHGAPVKSDASSDELVLEGEILPPEGASSDSGNLDEAVSDLEGELLDISADDLSADDLTVTNDAAGDHVADIDEGESERSVVPYSPLDAYLAEIRRFSPLSKEAEHAAAVEYHKTKSPEAAYTLVSGSLWLVVKIARDYERVAKNALDLIQEGNIGLMEAVRNFDPYRGVRFPSYAVWWIRAYIIRYIIANWRMVKIGTTQAQRKLFFNLKKESDRLEREGIYPSTKLLAERLNVKEGEVVEMSQRLGGADMSFDAPLQDDNDSSLLSVVPSDSESAEDQLAKKQLRDSLASSVSDFEATLNPKEQAIFKGRIITEDKLTLQDLSDALAISKERVRQIENKLREKLKGFVSKRLGSELDEWGEGT